MPSDINSFVNWFILLLIINIPVIHDNVKNWIKIPFYIFMFIGVYLLLFQYLIIYIFLNS